jgi:Fe2+ transport system protein FeoA
MKPTMSAATREPAKAVPARKPGTAAEHGEPGTQPQAHTHGPSHAHSRTHSLAGAAVGVAHEVVGITDDLHAPRLYELGFGEGSEVTVVKGGDPAIVTVGTGKFALARELLALVDVACGSGECGEK